MSVFRNAKSPFWQYDFERGGRRFCGSFNGKKGRPRIPRERPEREAERAEALVDAAATAPASERSRITLHDAGTRFWTEEAQHFADSAGEWGRIANLERLLGKHTYLDDIGDAEISKLVARRRTENARYKDVPVANRTVNADVECLQRIMRRAKRWKKRLPAEMPEWREHKLKEADGRTRSLTCDEDDALFAAIAEIRPDYRDMVEFALITSKRLSEVIFLEKAKVDRRAMTARAIQKGGQEIVIDLTSASLAILERNWMYHPTRCFTYVLRRGSRHGTRIKKDRDKEVRRPFTKNGWRTYWKKILVEAEISDFRFHDLRHTALTRVLAATGNLKAVQDAAHHASITSSARYAHTNSTQRRAALEAAEALRLPENSRKAKLEEEKKEAESK